MNRKHIFNFGIFWKDVENHENCVNTSKIYFVWFFCFFSLFLKKTFWNGSQNWVMTVSHVFMLIVQSLIEGVV